MFEVTYRKFLNDEFAARQLKNPSYSLRAYARDLGLSPTHLSDILREKGQLSSDRAATVVTKLNLNDFDSEIFLDLVEVECVGNEPAKMRAVRRLKAHFTDAKFLEPGTFAPIFEWYYLALMELLGTKIESDSPEYLGRRLGLAPEKIREALDLLLKNGLIAHDGTRLVVQNHTTPSDVPSEVVRRYHRQVLEKASTAMEEQDVSRRDVSAITIGIRRDKVGLVKERLRQFRRQLALELSEGVDKDSVYTLSMCFFEMTQGEAP